LRRIDAQRDDDIDYSDIPAVSDAWFAQAMVEPSPKKTLVSMRLDEDVLGWFRQGGRGYQTRINEVLRIYMLYQQRGEPAAARRAGSLGNSSKRASSRTTTRRKHVRRK
jgi:uncharacterized protein (DUF4415 family)